MKMYCLTIHYDDITVHSVSLAVSVVLTILAISVLLRLSESVSTYRICTKAYNKRHIDKLGVKLLSETSSRSILRICYKYLNLCTGTYMYIDFHVHVFTVYVFHIFRLIHEQITSKIKL